MLYVGSERRGEARTEKDPEGHTHEFETRAAAAASIPPLAAFQSIESARGMEGDRFKESWMDAY